MKNWKSLQRTALITAAALLAVGQALATPLVENSTVALAGTTVLESPQLAGVVLEDVVTPFSFASGAGLISGSVQSRVVRSSLDGTLDFYWRVMNDSTSAGTVGNLRLGGFTAQQFDANWRVDGEGAVAPVTAYLFSPVSDGNVNFNFAALQPGQGSRFMFLDTLSTQYQKSALLDLTDQDQAYISEQYGTFAPVYAAPVPEPESFAMLASGLALVGAALRRRRNRTA